MQISIDAKLLNDLPANVTWARVTTYNGIPIIATDRGVFQIKGDKIEPILLQAEGRK